MRESDLGRADVIFRTAFGTFIGLPDPATFVPDRDYVFTRFRANPEGALAAEVDGELAGSNFVTRWGSFGFFGPLTVRPELWSRGIAQALLKPTLELFDRWGVRDAALFTFVQSSKHVALYQKFGFWPGFLIGLMGKRVVPGAGSYVKFDHTALAACRELTELVYEGLDLTSEIVAVKDQNLGETVLIWGGDSLEGFAVCHCGAGTEAGEGNCYVKFAAVRPGQGSDARFDRLLRGIEALCVERGLADIETGINLERLQAYRQMLQYGFQLTRQALAMHRHASRAYNRADTYVLDDWR
jgi:GNAT superfamily N-acetyltransferase